MRLLFLIPLALFGASLKEKFSTAEVGDFMVSEQNKTYTLLRVFDKTASTITLEEASIPTHKAKKICWRSWLSDGAKDATSWITFTCDLTTGKLFNAYSHTKKAYIELTDSILSTLYSLHLDPIPPNEQKKIGPAPQAGELDFRKAWTPPKIIDGITYKGTHFDVYGTTWPSDGSEISGKKIELYFDKEFPFPYWLHVTDGTHTFKIRTIESGKNLTSAAKCIAPSYTCSLTSIGKDLRFTITAPFSSYTLFVLDLTNHDSFTLTPKTTFQGTTAHLDIDLNELSKKCIRGHTYQFYAAPHTQPELLIEAPQTYLQN